MKPYKPSNKIPQSGWQWLILSSLLGSLAIGGIASAISQLIYLIIAFPLVMGVTGGGILATAVKYGKVRNPIVTLVVGGLMGMGIYSTMFRFEYEIFKREMAEGLISEYQIKPSQTDEITQEFLQQETGDRGLIGFIKYYAQQGVSISEIGSSGSSDLHLSKTMAWLYWLLETGLISGMIMFAGYRSATYPFCEEADEWYDEPVRVGSIKNRDYERFIKAIDTHDLSLAGSLINPLLPLLVHYKEVYIIQCSKSRISQVVLQIHKVEVGGKGNLYNQEICQGMISASQYAHLSQKVIENYQIPSENRPDLANLIVFSQNDSVLSAQLERGMIAPSDTFVKADLGANLHNRLIQQISENKPVKSAYLVKKVVEHFPEHPFYILGIIRQRSWGIESENAPFILLKKLAEELELPDDTWIVILNKQKELEKSLQGLEGALIYNRSGHKSTKL